MGDRALILFHDEKTFGPTIYLHWGGESVPDLLEKTRERMEGRGGDVDYTTARCIGLAHEGSDGNLSLGTWNTQGYGDYQKARDRMTCTETVAWDKTRQHYAESHGDAGVFLVNVCTWEVEMFGGYGFGAGSHDGPPTKVQLPTGDA